MSGPLETLAEVVARFKKYNDALEASTRRPRRIPMSATVDRMSNLEKYRMSNLEKLVVCWIGDYLSNGSKSTLFAADGETLGLLLLKGLVRLEGPIHALRVELTAKGKEVFAELTRSEPK